MSWSNSAVVVSSQIDGAISGRCTMSPSTCRIRFSLAVEPLERRERPALQFGDRVRRVGIEQLAALPVGALDRLPKQRVLGPEVPEERDLVEVGLLRNPARRGTPVARLGVHTSGHFQQFFPGVDTHGRLRYRQFQRMQVPAYNLELTRIRRYPARKYSVK